MPVIHTILADATTITVAVIIITTMLTSVVFFLIIAKFFNLWVQARISGADLQLFDLIGMWFRKANPKAVVHSYIMASKAGLDVSIQQVEVHDLAGGNVQKVVRGLIAAQQAEVDLTWDAACAIDLTGRDLFAVVADLDPNNH